MAQEEDGQAGRPTLRLIRGNATPEEIAAVVALLAAQSVAAEPEPPSVRSGWSDPAQGHRGPLHAGPGAWRRSGLSPGVRTRAGW
ncbi:acyl-CoA carboxylase epsilon subunit [Frankia sp. AiPs1]|uniref:acyl-CoA carboxylase subunit epsilon n=1 Tax=Frankia sp. AiPa1 TaxID=573492 RepID=UPI00202ACF60|nr:acyl-CoA carboxylase subunit epsilon [Frankia sp. AiPa1]MCL9757709.1 acyl-CoA carboxylase subunit epsilon [Frankia sp. AiPa1]